MALVRNKDKVMALITKIIGAQPTDVDELLTLHKNVDAEADGLKLSFANEQWDTRLCLKKKGGGFHFDESERELAKHAFLRGKAFGSAADTYEMVRACIAGLVLPLSLNGKSVKDRSDSM